jgi:hypothetical protein
MIEFPTDPRIKPKTNQRFGGYLAPWRNTALTRAQQIATRIATRRMRITGDVVLGTRAHSSASGQIAEGAHAAEGKANRIAERLKAAFAAVIGALAPQR